MSANLILSLYHFFTKNVNAFFTTEDSKPIGPNAKALKLLEKSLQILILPLPRNRSSRLRFRLK